MFGPLLAALTVNRVGPGRPRTRPERVLGDKAYSAGPTVSCCDAAGLRRSSANPPTRRPTASGEEMPAAGRRPSTPRSTSSATPSSAASTCSSNGAGSPPLRQARPDLSRRHRPTRHHDLAPPIRRRVLAEDVSAERAAALLDIEMSEVRRLVKVASAEPEPVAGTGKNATVSAPPDPAESTVASRRAG